MTAVPAHLDTVRDRLIDLLDPADDLNFRHFRMRHMVAELLRTGLPPGREAPDFELPSTDGTRVRLSDLRGKPVLLHFVSYTCPVTRGGVYTMRELRGLYGERVQFVEVVVRQAHPGELHGAYRSQEEKLDDARALKREEHLPWPVLIDDLAGTVQRAYGGLAAAVYLIDSRGTIAFCGTWGQSPALRQAIDDLLARDQRPLRYRQGHRPSAAPGRRDRRRTTRPHPRRATIADRPGTRLPRRDGPHDHRQSRPPAARASGTAHNTTAKPGTRRSSCRPRRRNHRCRPTRPELMPNRLEFGGLGHSWGRGRSGPSPVALQRRQCLHISI